MKKRIIIITIIILVVAMTVGGFLIFRPKREETTQDPYIDRVKELVHNNDLLSYLYYGDIKTTDGFMIIDDVRYEYIADEKLNEIKSLTDIMNLIDNTFTDELKEVYYNDLNSGANNRYIMESNLLLVAKTKGACSNMKKEEAEIKYIEEYDKVIINAYGGMTALKRDNNLYLTGLAYSCDK